MSEEVLATFETTSDRLMEMLRWEAAPFDTEKFNQCYFNLSGEEINAIHNAGGAIVSYCTFQDPYVDDIELHDDVPATSGAEFILRVPQTEDYIQFVGGNDLTVTLFGSITEQDDTVEARASKIGIDGDLYAEIFLPDSNNDYSKKQLGIVQKYDPENNWITSDGGSFDTTFTTKCKEFKRINEMVDFENFALSNHPVVIEDGEFTLNVGDDNGRNKISGTLNAKNVSGPDVSNEYSRGFERLFDNISGEINVQTEQDAPIVIVRRSNDGALCCRYSILPAT